MNAETFNLEQALADILDASPGPAREFVYGYHWKRLAASEGHMKRLPQYKPPEKCAHVEAISEMIDEGLQNPEIARRLGLSRGGVANIIAKHGLSRLPQTEFFSDNVDPKELRRHVRKGLTNAAIAQKYDVSEYAVKRALARFRIKRRA